MGSSYFEKVWRNKYAIKPGINIIMAAGDAYAMAKDAKGLSEDTVLRRELQLKVIKPLAMAGKSVSEIVEILRTNSEYAKYSKFEKYFVGYAENLVGKAATTKSKEKNKDDFDER